MSWITRLGNRRCYFSLFILFYLFIYLFFWVADMEKSNVLDSRSSPKIESELWFSRTIWLICAHQSLRCFERFMVVLKVGLLYVFGVAESDFVTFQPKYLSKFYVCAIINRGSHFGCVSLPFHLLWKCSVAFFC